MTQDKINKTWKTVATFQSYNEADNLRKEILEKHALVKVKMGARAKKQNVYRVKCWDPLPAIVTKNIVNRKKENKPYKKGLKQRKHKNVN